MERDMTDLETLLPFVHAIHPFDAELPVGQVYMSFYSVAVVTKHDVGTKQVISNIRVAILPSTGCGNTLRQEGIPAAPKDLVIVSKIVREWSYQGTAQSKLASVHFYCKVSCVKRKKPDFEGHLCTVSA